MQLNRPMLKSRGQIIKDFRIIRSLTQDELASLLTVSVKAVGAWERGEVATIRQAHISALIEVLEIPPDLLGLPPYFNQEGMNSTEHDIKASLEKGAYVGALAACQSLVSYLTDRVKKDGRTELQSVLIRVMHLLASATATVTNDAHQALQQYDLMEYYAHQLKKPDLVAQAQAWMGQAEMYRRLGAFNDAQELLEMVKDTFKQVRLSGMEIPILGNQHQLSARVHLAKGEIGEMLDDLKEAQELAGQIPEMETPWYSCFNPCSVAQEQAKSFMLLRQYEKSFAFLQEAKGLCQYAAPRWVIPVTLTEGETYIRAARDVEPPHAKQMHNDAYYDIGIKQLLKGYELARNHNHLRQAQRVLRLTTQWQRIGGASLELAQTLQDGMAEIDRGKNVI